MDTRRTLPLPPFQYAPQARRSEGIAAAWAGILLAWLALSIEVPILALYFFAPDALAAVALFFFGFLWLPPLYLAVFPLFMIGFVRITTAYRLGGVPYASTFALLLCFVAMFLWISPILAIAWRR